MKKQFLKFISLALAVALCCVFLSINILAETKMEGEANEATNLFLDFQGESRPSEITGTSTVVADPVSEFSNDKVLMKSGNKDIIVNYVFKASSTYKIKFDYFMEVADDESLPWIDMKVNTWNGEEFVWDPSLGSVKGWGSYTANQWNHIEFTYAPDSDKSPLMFKHYTANTMYIDNLSISETSASVSNGNTAVSQSYDFDNVDFNEYSTTKKCVTGVVAVDGKKNFAKNFDGTNGDSEIIVKLDYPLIEGKYYKLSYDYKGSSAMCVYQSLNGLANRTDACPTDILVDNGDSSIYNYILRDSVDNWRTYDTIFYAKQTSNYIGILVPSGKPSISIDNIKIEECDANTSTVTAFPLKYKVDFENITLDSLGVSSNADFEIVSDPVNSENKVLKHSATVRSAIFVQEARLIAGHDYEITYEFFTPDKSKAPSIRHILRGKDGAKSYTSDYVATWSEENVWVKQTYNLTAEGGEFLQLYLDNNTGGVGYIDNIIIRDLTPDSYSTNYEDEEIFIEEDTTRTAVTYENDDVYGKVAKITYAPKANLGGYTKFPVKLKDSEAYKITLTYKTSAWATVHYAAKAEAPKWSIDSRDWKTVTYYVTGTGDNDYFGFKCNNATEDLNIWVADVSIERKTVSTDLNADGLSDKTDVSLLRDYLLNGRNDLKMFEKFTEQNGIDGVDIRDLVALNISVAE